MGQADWQVARTEEGLQLVLRRLKECQATGDLVETGHGLLALSNLVVWVRSDTDLPPFARAHELAMEALEAFRNAGDKQGQVRSLIRASSMASPDTCESMMSEAESLTAELGDEDNIAMTLAARARALAMSDRAGADGLHRRALTLYRGTGNLRGQARCLFSLCFGEGSRMERRDFAMEGARLFRALGDFAEASRCVTLAMINAEEIQPITELGDLAQQGLQDALEAGNRGQEQHFYEKLQLIALAKGETEEAEKYRRWAKELQDADGLTPLERWKKEVQMLKLMIAMAKSQGHEDAGKMFRDELKRMKASKPS